MARRTSLDDALIESAKRWGNCIGTTLVTIILTLWFVLRPSESKCYLSAFAVPALDKNTNATTINSPIIFMVELHNENDNVGIQYDDVNITVGVFLDRNTTSPIGSSIIERFYQGHKKTAQKWSSVEAHAGAFNGTASLDGKAYFRVDFKTYVRYKTWFIYSGRSRLWGGANVAVNDDGLKDEKDNIRLGHYFPVIVPSGAPPFAAGGYGMLLVLGLLVHFVV